MGDRDTAIDATQDAFRKAFSARGAFLGRAAASTWLYRIAYNTCISKLEARRPHAPLEEDRPDPAASRPDASAERRETVRSVQGALARLGEEDRRLLCLQMEEELGYAELAEVLDCSVEAARQRVSRARRRLKEILTETMERRS